MAINVEQLIEIIKNIANIIEENKELLTELDSVIGDGDHGINMDKGFRAVKKELDITDNNIKDILENTGKILLSTVGGASGILFGIAFIKASKVANQEEINIENFIQILQVSVEEIKLRGKVKKGEKTMIDVLEPALDDLKLSYQVEKDSKVMLNNMLKKAREGLEYTKTIKAIRGRAEYLGEKSIGHRDPGAMTSYLLLKEIVNYINSY